MAAPQVSELTTSQAERRDRCVRAALALASEGGYDAVQMREVATRAEVALGTLYRYFVSKDHLLAAVMYDGIAGLADDVRDRPPTGPATETRLMDIFDRVFRTLEANPQAGTAMVAGFNVTGDEISVLQVETQVLMTSILARAFPPGQDPDVRRKVIRSLEHVWGSTLNGWMIGWLTLDQAREELADAVHLMVGRPPR